MYVVPFIDPKDLQTTYQNFMAFAYWELYFWLDLLLKTDCSSLGSPQSPSDRKIMEIEGV